MTSLAWPVCCAGPAGDASREVECLRTALDRLDESMPHNIRQPRVLLADDHVYMHQVMSRLLVATCDVVGAVSDGADLLGAIERLRPDVVVVDLNMPKLSGIEACRRIRATTPSVKVIVVSADDDPDIRKVALQVGASGFVAKMHASDDLPSAIQEAFASIQPSTLHDTL